MKKTNPEKRRVVIEVDKDLHRQLHKMAKIKGMLFSVFVREMLKRMANFDIVREE